MINTLFFAILRPACQECIPVFSRIPIPSLTALLMVFLHPWASMRSISSVKDKVGFKVLGPHSALQFSNRLLKDVSVIPSYTAIAWEGLPPFILDVSWDYAGRIFTTGYLGRVIRRGSFSVENGGSICR